MPLQSTYFLADVDGVLCIAARSTDWSEPRYVVNYWPTRAGTLAVCRNLEVKPEELRELVTVAQELPGAYVVTHVRGERVYGDFYRIGLTEGGRTQSIKTTYEPVPVPRVSANTKREWRDGRWYIYPPKGKPRVVTV